MSAILEFLVNFHTLLVKCARIPSLSSFISKSTTHDYTAAFYLCLKGKKDYVGHRSYREVKRTFKINTDACSLFQLARPSRLFILAALCDAILKSLLSDG
ncbi:hypothetical protein RF11_16318 [Thelohanellus kitauei]|uniref:Uncharacterized protein n=1 Tax=Thelohanellus kitauei TaxID=669202 RepID=A0A0C2J3Q9_THEKT|nr:hypothetical protein RF11_16318 [Thelohanellus kitauei]